MNFYDYTPAGINEAITLNPKNLPYLLLILQVCLASRCKVEGGEPSCEARVVLRAAVGGAEMGEVEGLHSFKLLYRSPTHS